MRIRTLPHIAAFALGAMAAVSPVAAQPITAAEAQLLRAEIEQLRAEQAARNAEMQQAAERLKLLENSLDRLEGKPAAASAQVDSPAASPAPASAAMAVPATPSRFQLSGDLRLRYESNFGDSGARDRDRGVIRARLRGTYKLSDWLTMGGQVATGDPDDPNSTDVALSNFDDDLQISLDQVYARFDLGRLQIFGGKMPMPFVRTDLTWDSDVSPQGASASYTLPLGAGASAKLSTLYFLVDESVAGPDSDMVGAQVAFDARLSNMLRLELAGGYYDYSLRSRAGGDAGDFRTNLIGPDGHYLSDFDLIDGIATLTYQGLGEYWPIRLTGNYVRNLGAATAADSGFGLDLLVGRASQPGDWRLGYGYAVADTDAVLAAFSQDNTGIATNYRQHMLTLDYALRSGIILNATLYHYRPKNAQDAGPNDARDWLNRLRLNFLMTF